VWGAMLGLNTENAADIDSLSLNIIQDATVCSLENLNFKV